jgi:hypothetical protein
MFLLAVAVAVSAQVVRQGPPPAPGVFQFVARTDDQSKPDTASLYRCNTVTGEVAVLEAHGDGKDPAYRWRTIVASD